MLKVKDNVDLKELDKFGFKPRYDEYTGKINAYVKISETNSAIGLKVKHISNKAPSFRIFKKRTDLWVVGPLREYLDVDTLYDLIQAGIIEKYKER